MHIYAVFPWSKKGADIVEYATERATWYTERILARIKLFRKLFTKYFYFVYIYITAQHIS